MKRLLVLAALLGSACGTDTQAPSPITNLTGNWVGTVTSISRSQIVGVGTLRVTIAQSSGTLTGTWSASYQNPANNNSGQLVGAVMGISVNLNLQSSVPTACPFTATGTINDPNHISGTYATTNCTVSDSGPFVMNK